MRKFLPLGLLLVSAAAAAVLGARAAGEPSARQRLAALDRSGAAPANEVARLAREALASAPGDATLLWRRGDARRRLGQDDLALADLQQLIRTAPGSPYAVRAQRALPVLLARVGLDGEAAEADEALIAGRLADPVAVLPRLAATYARLGRSQELLETIGRLRALDRARADGDPEVAWLEADALERRGPPREAAAVMLAFAARFPGDRRRGEALVRAARARAETGELAQAIELAGRAVAEPLPPASAAWARVARAELLERAGRSREAAADLRAVLETGADEATIERVLSRYVDIEMERRGTEGALTALAALVAGERPAVAGPARRRMEALLEGLAASRPTPPERAAFLVALAGRADPALAIPPALRLAAAQLWEGVGDCARAARTYRELASAGPPVEGEAERGLERCRAGASTP